MRVLLVLDVDSPQWSVCELHLCVAFERDSMRKCKGGNLVKTSSRVYSDVLEELSCNQTSQWLELWVKIWIFSVGLAGFPIKSLTGLVNKSQFSWDVPPGWESRRHGPQWLEARAQTIRRTFPKGCVKFWPTRRWPIQSSGRESTRRHSTNSHPPVGSTAPYLGWRHKSTGNIAFVPSYLSFKIYNPLLLFWKISYLNQNFSIAFSLLDIFIDVEISCHSWDEDINMDYCLQKLSKLSFLLAQNCQSLQATTKKSQLTPPYRVCTSWKLCNAVNPMCQRSLNCIQSAVLYQQQRWFLLAL